MRQERNRYEFVGSVRRWREQIGVQLLLVMINKLLQLTTTFQRASFACQLCHGCHFWHCSRVLGCWRFQLCHGCHFRHCSRALLGCWRFHRRWFYHCFCYYQQKQFGSHVCCLVICHMQDEAQIYCTVRQSYVSNQLVHLTSLKLYQCGTTKSQSRPVIFSVC